MKILSRYLLVSSFLLSFSSKAEVETIDRKSRCLVTYPFCITQEGLTAGLISIGVIGLTAAIYMSFPERQNIQTILLPSQVIPTGASSEPLSISEFTDLKRRFPSNQALEKIVLHPGTTHVHIQKMWKKSMPQFRLRDSVDPLWCIPASPGWINDTNRKTERILSSANRQAKWIRRCVLCRRQDNRHFLSTNL